VALGVAGGYLLGRTKKMKLALMLGGMAAGRRAGGPGELLSRGTKLVEASPELSRLVGEVRGRLIEAGKGAAVALATRQVEALTDRVGQRVESLASGGVPKRAKAAQEPAPERPAEDEYDQDEAAQDEPAQDEPAQDETAQDEPAQDEPAQDEPARDDGSPAERDEEPAEERAARPRRTRAPAAKATAARSGRGNSASAPVKRTASGTDRAAGRKPARAARTRRGNGDG
jgi:hypothetical protein